MEESAGDVSAILILFRMPWFYVKKSDKLIWTY